MTNTREEDNSFVPRGVLLVDDESNAHAAVRTALAGMLELNVYTCREPGQMESVASKTMDICILDIRFRGQRRFGEARANVRHFWPNAKIIGPSNFPGDLDNEQRDGVELINKAMFNINPHLLPEAILRITDPDQPQERELLRLVGYIVELQDNFVEVAVHESTGDSALERYFGHGLSRLITQSGERPLRLLRMRSAKFLRAGIGQDMAFTYRIYSKGSQTISDVSSLEVPGPLVGSDLGEDAGLLRLRSIQEEAFSALRQEMEKRRKHL